MFARVVGRGLDSQRLVATYKEADKLAYQDSLGHLLLAVARTVPDGLLLFLPSYALMDKLSKRWQVRPHWVGCAIWILYTTRKEERAGTGCWVWFGSVGQALISLRVAPWSSYICSM